MLFVPLFLILMSFFPTAVSTSEPSQPSQRVQSSSWPRALRHTTRIVAGEHLRDFRPIPASYGPPGGGWSLTVAAFVANTWLRTAVRLAEWPQPVRFSWSPHLVNWLISRRSRQRRIAAVVLLA